MTIFDTIDNIIILIPMGTLKMSKFCVNCLMEDLELFNSSTPLASW